MSNNNLLKVLGAWEADNVLKLSGESCLLEFASGIEFGPVIHGVNERRLGMDGDGGQEVPYLLNCVPLW